MVHASVEATPTATARRRVPAILVWCRRHPVWTAFAAAVLLVAGGLVGLHYFVAYHYDAAVSAVEIRNIALAREHISYPLRFWPWSADVHLLAARIERLDQTTRRDLNLAERHLKECLRLRGTPTERYQIESRLLFATRYSHGFDEAKDSLWAFAKEHPDHPETPYILECLANGYMRRQRYQMAREALDRWVKVEPDNPRARYWRAWVRERLEAHVADISEDYEKVIEVAPWIWAARLRYAQLLLRENKAQEAWEQLEPLLAEHADDPEVQLAHGQYLILVQKLDKARSVLANLYNETLAQAKLNVSEKRRLKGEAAYELARLENQDARPEVAEQWARKAVKHLPGHGPAHFQLYRALVGQGKSKEAALQKARQKRVDEASRRLLDLLIYHLEQRISDPDIHSEIGGLYLTLGQPDQAKQWLDKALELDPDHRQAHRHMAAYYRAVGNAQAAERHEALAKATRK